MLEFIKQYLMTVDRSVPDGLKLKGKLGQHFFHLLAVQVFQFSYYHLMMWV